MRFDKYFKIMLTESIQIELKEAARLADIHICDLVFDRYGLSTYESWHFCNSVLMQLKQENHIFDFEIIKGPPKAQKIEEMEEEGVVY